MFIWWWWWRFWWSKATRLLEFSRSRLTLRPSSEPLVQCGTCWKSAHSCTDDKDGSVINLDSPPDHNLGFKGAANEKCVCNEKFGINCDLAEAQFGTGRGIIINKGTGGVWIVAGTYTSESPESPESLGPPELPVSPESPVLLASPVYQIHQIHQIRQIYIF